MRKFLVVALVLSMGMAALSLWRAGKALDLAATSSQIFIHGTPVCVTQRGGEIHAAVGDCGGLRGEPRNEGREGAHGRLPAPGRPGLELPPGHPPIGPDDGPITERNRRTLI